MRVSLLLLVFCPAAALLSTTAMAQQTVLTLETAFEGDISEPVADRFREALHRGLTATSTEEVLTEAESRSRLGSEASRLMRCGTDASCLVEAGRVSDADAAVLCAVSVAGEIYSFTIDVYDLNTGDGVYYDDADCPLCTVEEALDGLRAMAETAGTTTPTAEEPVAAMPEAGPTEVTLFIRTTPDSARVSLDDEPLGVGVVEATVGPGTYRMRAEADGYETIEEEITVAEGDEDQVVNVRLREIGAERPATGPIVRSGGALDGVNTTLIGSILAGTGLASLITGVVLLAIDGETTCSEGAIDECPDVYETGAGGTILTVLGSAALTTGAILLLWDALAGEPRPTSTPDTAGLNVAFGEDRAFLLFGGVF